MFSRCRRAKVSRTKTAASHGSVKVTGDFFDTEVARATFVLFQTRRRRVGRHRPTEATPSITSPPGRHSFHSVAHTQVRGDKTATAEALFTQLLTMTL